MSSKVKWRVYTQKTSNMKIKYQKMHPIFITTSIGRAASMHFVHSFFPLLSSARFVTYTETRIAHACIPRYVKCYFSFALLSHSSYSLVACNFLCFVYCCHLFSFSLNLYIIIVIGGSWCSFPEGTCHSIFQQFLLLFSCCS